MKNDDSKKVMPRLKIIFLSVLSKQNSNYQKLESNPEIYTTFEVFQL